MSRRTLASQTPRESTYLEDWRRYKDQAKLGTAIAVGVLATLVIGVNLWRALRT